MRVYYAHCTAIYNTPQEVRDELLLARLFPGAELVNPNRAAIQGQCDNVRAKYILEHGDSPTSRSEAGHQVMERVFQPLAMSCDVLAFRALPGWGAMIPAGVAKEIQWAIWAGKAVIELPSLMEHRKMSVEATRQYLLEVGQR